MKTNIFKGTGIALITPFKQDQSIDVEALTRIVNHVIDNGADFLVVLGTTSEAPTLSSDEKRLVINTILKTNSGRLPIMLGMGGNNTQAVIDAIKAQDFTGIQGILSVVPYYNKPNQRGMKAHFEAIADASPVPADFDVLSGDDGITQPLMALGAQGVISVAANAYTKPFSRMMRAMKEGRTDEALRLHYAMLRMNQLIFADGNPAGIKCLMSHLRLCENVLRLPLVKANEKVEADIIEEWKQLKNK